MFAAIDAGCAAVRVNPGNIKAFDDKVGEIARAAKDAGTPIRIGVNAGSLDKRLLAKYGKATPEALVESALWECSLFEEHDFRDIKISVKHNDPVIMVRAYELLAEQCDYPLHLGVTEAGPTFQGTIKSAVAFGALLSKGIGDTIRVSLSAPPVEEVKVGLQILESLNLRERGLEIVSCPSCGRAQVDVYTLAEQVTAGLEGLDVPLRVAVMGCVVNGPGEAREADLGVASGNGKGQIFVKGEVIKTVPESQIVETLIEEAMRLADAHARRRGACGEPSVTDGRESDSASDGTGSPYRGGLALCAHSFRRDREGNPFDDLCTPTPVVGGRSRASPAAPGVAVLTASFARVLGSGTPRRCPGCWPPTRSSSCMVAARFEQVGMNEAAMGGQFWGVGGGRDGLLFAGASMVPLAGDASAMRSFAHDRRPPRPQVRHHPGTGRPGAAAVGAARTPWGPARDVRADQPLMACAPIRSGRSTRTSGWSGRTRSRRTSRLRWRCSPRRSASTRGRATTAAATAPGSPT